MTIAPPSVLTAPFCFACSVRYAAFFDLSFSDFWSIFIRANAFRFSPSGSFSLDGSAAPWRNAAMTLSVSALERPSGSRLLAME